jgi:hypothetical protein
MTSSCAIWTATAWPISRTPEGWTLRGPFSGTVSVADDPSAAWSYLAGRMKCAGDLDGDGNNDVIAVARTSEGLGIQAFPGSALIAGGSLAG